MFPGPPAALDQVVEPAAVVPDFVAWSVAVVPLQGWKVRGDAAPSFTS